MSSNSSRFAPHRLKTAVISLQDTLLSKIGAVREDLSDMESTLQELDEKLSRAEEAHENSAERETFTVSGVLMLLRALMTLLPKDHCLASDLKDLFARGRNIEDGRCNGLQARTGEIAYEDDDYDHRPSPERTAQRPPSVLQNGTDGATDVRSILNF